MKHKKKQNIPKEYLNSYIKDKLTKSWQKNDQNNKQQNTKHNIENERLNKANLTKTEFPFFTIILFCLFLYIYDNN